MSQTLEWICQNLKNRSKSNEMEASRHSRNENVSPGRRITKTIEKIAQAKSINLYENFEGIATELYHIHRQNRKCKEVQNRWNFRTEIITQDLYDTKRNSGWGSYRKTRKGKPLHLTYMKKSPPGSYRRVLNRKDVKGCLFWDTSTKSEIVESSMDSTMELPIINNEFKLIAHKGGKFPRPRYTGKCFLCKKDYARVKYGQKIGRRARYLDYRHLELGLMYSIKGEFNSKVKLYIKVGMLPALETLIYST